MKRIVFVTKNKIYLSLVGYYSGSGWGISAQFGFDWYFTEGLSLGGKYAFGFRSLGEAEVTSEGETEKGPSSTSFGISTFSVLLNVHF